MKRTADIVVVGAGIAGAATAYFLTRHGAANVLLLDKGGVAAGATGYSAALMRVSYAHPGLLELARRSWDINMRWDEEVGEGTNGFRKVGVLYVVGPEDAREFMGHRDRLRELGIRGEFLEPDDVRRHFPYFNVDDMAGCLYEPEGGYGDGSSAATSLVEAARKGGATFRPDTGASTILVEGGRVHGVTTPDGTVESPVVVVAAGAWSGNLLHTAGVSLPIRAQRMSAVILERPPEVPVHPAIADRVIDFYCRPEGDSLTLADLGHLDWQDPVDPDAQSFTPTHEHVERVGRHLMRRIPAMEGATVRTGYNVADAFTPDGLPALGPVPGVEGLYVATGFNGDGLKFGAVVGESMADLVLRGRARLVDLSPFDPARFDRPLESDALLGEYHPTPLA